MKFLVALSGVALLLSGCGGKDSDVLEKAPSSSTSPVSGTHSSSAEPSTEPGDLLEYGFGQQGESVEGVALVKNDSEHAGQTVTVSMNFLAADGSIITTADQVDGFNYPGQTIAVVIDADSGNAHTKVASVEPTLLVEDEDVFDSTEVDFGTAEGTDIHKKYGQWSAKFIVKNPTADALQSPNVSVACRDASGHIIGGGYDYPDLVPPNGQVVSQPSLTVSGTPASCTAYIGGPVF